jgi:4-hydroxy-tetrahydrodipicolinate reductase
MPSLRLALIGYGRMGRQVEAQSEGHGAQVVARIDEPPTADALAGCDAAIDFSHGESVRANALACLAAGVPIVVGTTGWDADREDVYEQVRGGGGALVHGANFSVGVNLFYRVAQQAAGLFAAAGYAPFLEEQHHAAKRDAPSGTALHLKRLVDGAFEQDVDVAVVRAGSIPGTHRVGFDAGPDQVVLSHVARSRDGFADGALRAARWIVGKRGVFAFADVLDDVLAHTAPPSARSPKQA